MGRGLIFPSPQLLAARCPASFRTFNVTSSEAALCRQPSPPSLPSLCSTLMRTENSHVCINVCLSVSPTGKQAPQGQGRSLPSPPLECMVCTSHSTCICCPNQPFLPRPCFLLTELLAPELSEPQGFSLFFLPKH